MAKRLKKTEDPAETAHRVLSRVVDLADPTAEPVDTGKDAAAAELGRRGGLAGGKKGGEKRAKALSPERRSEIAKKAAQARWAKRADDS